MRVEAPSDRLSVGARRGPVAMKRPLLPNPRRRFKLVLALARLRATFHFRALASVAALEALLGPPLAVAVAVPSNHAVIGAERDEPGGAIAAVALRVTASAIARTIRMRPPDGSTST